MKFGNLEIVQSSKYSQEPGNLSKSGQKKFKSSKYGEFMGFFPPKHPLYEWQAPFFSCHHVAKFCHKKNLAPIHFLDRRITILFLPFSV
jgi:hypothetical protein